jgi:2Fe-2S ferredoxin
MPRIVFVAADGVERALEAPEGTSAMRAALTNAVDAIEAECGGSLACGTCHVYVDRPFLSKLPAISPPEEEMLGFVAAERRDNSRLSCQIVLTAALDGIVVHLPDRQR